ncbi:MAG: hypothetical protein HY910_04685 [Desulfarculus sp.]|nr:hypothetical protein [Desulfarculus sp.]
MTIGPVIKLVSGHQEAKALRLLCPFCGRDGVEIEEVRECPSRSAGNDKLSNHISFVDSAICEYKARCPGCGKSYLQSCPSDRLPKSFRPEQVSAQA